MAIKREEAKRKAEAKDVRLLVAWNRASGKKGERERSSSKSDGVYERPRKEKSKPGVARTRKKLYKRKKEKRERTLYLASTSGGLWCVGSLRGRDVDLCERRRRRR